MKSKFVLIYLLLTIICVASCENLTCYSCFFFDGHPASDPNCETNPSTVKICDSGTGSTSLAYEKQVDAYVVRSSNDNSIVYKLGATGRIASVEVVIMMCSTFTGTLDNKTVIVRGCGYGEKTLSDNCTNATLIVDNRPAFNATACLCSMDKCNTPSNTYPTTTTNLPPSGASCCKSTFHSLLAITIYCMFKYVSL